MLVRNEWEREVETTFTTWRHKPSFDSISLEYNSPDFVDLVIVSPQNLETLIQVLQWEKESSTPPPPVDLRDYVANDGRSVWQLRDEARRNRVSPI